MDLPIVVCLKKSIRYHQRLTEISKELYALDIVQVVIP